MQKRSIPISFVVILFSIATVLFQFGSYYFLDSILIMIGITIVFSLIINHFILEISLDYNTCLLYTVLNMLFGTLLVIAIYFYQSNNYLFYTKKLFFVIVLDWLVAVGYTILRNLFDPGPKFIGFVSYFKKTSFFFCIFYGFMFFLFIFKNPIVLPASAAQPIEYNLIPFKTMSAHIEDFMYRNIPLEKFLWYCIQNMFLYMPYGFFISLIFQKNSFFTRATLLTLFPLITETIQYAYDIGRCDIDDFALAIIGSTLGIFIFFLINWLYHVIKGENFLYEPDFFDFYDKQYYK